jgi:hypothetical protein
MPEQRVDASRSRLMQARLRQLILVLGPPGATALRCVDVQDGESGRRPGWDADQRSGMSAMEFFKRFALTGVIEPVRAGRALGFVAEEGGKGERFAAIRTGERCPWLGIAVDNKGRSSRQRG